MTDATPDPLDDTPTNRLISPGQAVVDAMVALLGVPYQWGGKSLDGTDYGLDCSGAVCLALNAAGLVPDDFARQHNAESLWHMCEPVPVGRAQPGDLAFFHPLVEPGRVSHVVVVADADCYIGACGGGPKCTTVEIARQLGACVRYEPRATYRVNEVVGVGRWRTLVAGIAARREAGMG